MKKLLPVIAFLAVATALAVQRPAVAEDPKPDMDLFDNEDGVKVWKPKGKDQWKIVGAGSWDSYFKDADGVQFMLLKWAADNKDGDQMKSPPLVRVFAFRYDTQGKFKIGDWEGTPSSTKGFARAIFDKWMADEYKNPKNIQETDKAVYPCGKCYQFSCYGEHKKYGGSHYVRVLVCKKDSKYTYEIRVGCAPGEEKADGKHSGEEIEQVLKSIQFYDKKK
ncbi:MAG: hypothetical protein FD180_1251 [Planctomycetota bacterium]|nr:MAG: hypothetical protein FD180_1251 [Planctomycetota bacterium]